MAKKYSHEVLFGEVSQSTVDYKVSLNQDDEDAGLADYFAQKISSKNLSKRECELNPNLVYCEITDHKIVLSPNGGGGSTGDYEIIIDSYPILDSTGNDMELPRPSGYTKVAYLFPMQLATGSIKRITIARSQNDGGTIGDIYIGVYANDKPTAIGARLLFDTVSKPPSTKLEDGVFTYTSDLPELPGYSEVDGKQVQNTFFYIVFRVEEATPGFKILVRDSDLSKLAALAEDGIISFGVISNFTNDFHQTFDYSVDASQTTLSTMRTPYMNITMII